LKIATCTVNGFNGRLPRLLEWRETSPAAARLQTTPVRARRERDIAP
jgi:hypothetical protein